LNCAYGNTTQNLAHMSKVFAIKVSEPIFSLFHAESGLF